MAKLSQPCPLLFGESAGSDLDLLDGLIQRAAAFEIVNELGVADR